MDLSTPVSGITWPNPGAFVSSAAVTIRGTADDLYCTAQPALCNPSRQYESGLSGAGVVSVAVAEITASTNWWNGGTFASATPIFLPVTTYVGASSGTWTFVMPGGALTSTKVYRAVVRAQDAAGNLDIVSSTNSFVYDAAAPVSLATAPVGFNNQIFTISGTARDDNPGALSVVRVTLHETTPVSQWWNGNAWQGAPVEFSSGVIGALITGTTYAWSYDATGVGFFDDSTYTVTARAVTV